MYGLHRISGLFHFISLSVHSTPMNETYLARTIHCVALLKVARLSHQKWIYFTWGQMGKSAVFAQSGSNELGPPYNSMLYWVHLTLTSAKQRIKVAG